MKLLEYLLVVFLVPIAFLGGIAAGMRVVNFIMSGL